MISKLISSGKDREAIDAISSGSGTSDDLIDALHISYATRMYHVIDCICGVAVEKGIVSEALMYSARAGRVDAIKMMVGNGVTIEQINDAAAIAYAASSGHLPVIEYLVSIEASLDRRGWLALAEASASHYMDIVEYLLQHGVSPSGGGGYPLYAATVAGHIDVVKYLLDHGANVHARHDSLIAAAEHNMVEIMACLVSRGADVHIRNDSPLIVAATKGCTSAVEYLLKFSYNKSSLNLAMRKAADSGFFDVVMLLIDHGANYSAYDYYPLRRAAKYGSVETLREMVSRIGCISNDVVNTLLWHAVKGMNIEVVKYLTSL